MPDYCWFEDPLPPGRVITADDAKTAAQMAADRVALIVQPGDTATLAVWIGRRFEFTVDATNIQPRVVRVKP
jgi:hypothetical protein